MSPLGTDAGHPPAHDPAARARHTQRYLLVAIALLFIAPVAIAFYLYYAGGWRPTGATHHGELITPARPLPEAALPLPEGGATKPDFLRGQWSLLYVGEGACDARCRQALYEMRQVRLALNQNMDRVQRVFLYSGHCCEQPFFAAEHAGLVAANVDPPRGGELVQAFGGPGRDSTLAEGRIYVVDPLGNLVLSYPTGASPKGMIADLKRLLKLSHIG